MIDITYHRKFHRVTIKGHAHSAELGRDLICAAASALAYTLAENVNALHLSGAAKNTIVQMREGDAEICCDAHRKMRSVATLVYDTVCRGFEILQEHYPEHVRYTVMG